MDNFPTIFEFQGSHRVRLFRREDGPWFVAKDVCDVLEHANPTQVISRLDEDERNTLHIAEGNRGNPNVGAVNETGLYSLILTSRVPSAKAFERRVDRNCASEHSLGSTSAIKSAKLTAVQPTLRDT